MPQHRSRLGGNLLKRMCYAENGKLKDLVSYGCFPGLASALQRLCQSLLCFEWLGFVFRGQGLGPRLKDLRESGCKRLGLTVLTNSLMLSCICGVTA